MRSSTAATGSAGLLLPADTPALWSAVHPEARAARHDEPTPDGAAGPAWATAAHLLADDAAVLRAAHARACEEDGAFPAAAAKWVVSWFAGGLADAVGFMFAGASAAPLVRLDRARWRLHRDGWPDRVDPGDVPVAVAAGHPWAGLPGTVTLADDEEVAARAVPALVAAVAPLVEAGRTLAKVGCPALWAEVSDALGLPVLHQPALPVDGAAARRLALLVDAVGVPWLKRPELRIADTADGPAYLGRKGGCCLAYKCPPGESESLDDLDDLDDRQRAYRERFPLHPDERRYCSTCSLRDLAGCEERQVFWLQQERAARRAAP